MDYSPAVLERVRDPKYVGWLPRDAPDVGTGEAGTIEHGTMTRIQVRIARAGSDRSAGRNGWLESDAITQSGPGARSAPKEHSDHPGASFDRTEEDGPWVVTEAVFKVFGCSAAIASASLVTERLRGVTLARAAGMDALAIVAELQLPIERANVAALAVEAARHAIADWERKPRRHEGTPRRHEDTE